MFELATKGVVGGRQLHVRRPKACTEDDEGGGGEGLRETLGDGLGDGGEELGNVGAVFSAGIEGGDVDLGGYGVGLGEAVWAGGDCREGEWEKGGDGGCGLGGGDVGLLMKGGLA